MWHSFLFILTYKICDTILLKKVPIWKRCFKQTEFGKRIPNGDRTRIMLFQKYKKL